MNSSSIFTRHVLASVCAFEQFSAAHDPEYMEGGEIAYFHAEVHETPEGYEPIQLLNSPKHPVDTYRIVDQYGSLAGIVDICDEAATFAYSIATG